MFYTTPPISKKCPVCKGKFMKLLKVGMILGILPIHKVWSCKNCKDGRIYPKRVIIEDGKIEPTIQW